MIGILVEKPSQARNFSTALGGMAGVFEGEAYQIVPARGHLYGFVEKPEEMVKSDLKEKYHSWDLANLPWNETDLNWTYATKGDVKAELQKILQTLKGCDEIVIGTDDDPTGEGEMIAWEIISELRLKVGKYTRMYFADESEKEIQKAFRNRKLLGTDISCMYQDGDYLQALFRAKWDYMSMQWTRVATSFAPYPQVPRQGRLKSAMVRLVGDQLKAIQDYVEKPYFEPRFKDENGNVFINPDVERHADANDVPIGQYKTSAVVKDSTTRKQTAPRKFLDLASLAAMLAPKGISAKQVLSTYQKMYEAKVVSYPRTEDKCITMEQFNELLPLVDKIAGVVGVDTSFLTHRTPRKTHVKTGMAHGANRPGLNVPGSIETLDGIYGVGAQMIYEILARNYLATLCEDYEYDLEQGHLLDYPDFKGSAQIPRVAGWHQVFAEDDDTEDTSVGLGTSADPFVYRGVNPKPTQPTMKWLMKQLDKRNVGTGATRTSIYADVTNSKSKYPLLVEKRGKITMAPVGETSYMLLPNTHIGSLDLTEKVMTEMKAIFDGQSDGSAFLHDIQQMILEDIDTMRENAKSLPQSKAAAPAKERYEGMWKGKKSKFVRVWSEYRFTDAECDKLLAGEKIKITATSKAGKPFTCLVYLKEKTYNGHGYLGIEPEFSKIPDTYLQHDFSDAEKKSLEDGNEIFVRGMVSGKGNVFDAYVKYGKNSKTGKMGLCLRFKEK